MASNREKAKGRRSGKPFLRLPRDVIASQEFADLSGNAVKLLVNLGAQYRGNNNGDLTTAWSIMKKCGWKSKDTLYTAIYEVEEYGFIIRTKQGGMNIGPNLFALSWEPIDECGGKLDIRSTRTAPNTWKNNSQVRDPYQTSTNIVPMRKK